MPFHYERLAKTRPAGRGTTKRRKPAGGAKRHKKAQEAVSRKKASKQPKPKRDPESGQFVKS